MGLKIITRLMRVISPAAPDGGASSSLLVRGCLLVGLISFGPTVGKASGDLIPVDVPSGQDVSLYEVLIDEEQGGPWVRFRFVAPRIGDTQVPIAVDVSIYDMEHLCDAVAVPYVKEYDLTPDRVVISFSDRILPFGQSDPEATQLFEMFSLEQSQCVWEGF